MEAIEEEKLNGNDIQDDSELGSRRPKNDNN